MAENAGVKLSCLHFASVSGTERRAFGKSFGKTEVILPRPKMLLEHMRK